MFYKLTILGCVMILIFTQGISQGTLYNQSIQKLDEANSIEGDFEKVKSLAQEALIGFEQLDEPYLALDAKLQMAFATKYVGDSLRYINLLDDIIDEAQSLNDSASLIKAYNYKSFYQFELGNTDLGEKYLNIPYERSYYSSNAIEETVINLGSLIDVNIAFAQDPNQVYEYLNRLIELRDQYDHPAVHIVSSFKQATLLRKSGNYEEALEVLKRAEKYLDLTKNKGYILYYYDNLIKTYTKLNKPQEALKIINLLEEKASYDPGDPRNCRLIIAKTRSELNLNPSSDYRLSQEFVSCYLRIVEKSKNNIKLSINDLSAIYTMCLYKRHRKDWQELEALLYELLDHARSSKASNMISEAYLMQYNLFVAQDQTDKALKAHLDYTNAKKESEQYTYAQSEALWKNRLNYELSQKENLLLQKENQNQQLIIEQGRRTKIFWRLCILFMGGLLLYYLRASRINKKKSSQLESLVNQRTAELKSSNEALQTSNEHLMQSNEELKRFAFLTSHDLKTPLHNMIKFTSILERHLQSNIDDSTKEYLNLIRNGGKQMDRLITDVLEYSQLSYDPDSQDVIEPESITSIIAEIESMISQYIKEKNAEIIVDYDLYKMKASKPDLVILFKNLIENGIKYNTADKPIIKIYGQEYQDTYRLHINDNGIGIDEEFHDTVFSMFSRLHTHQNYEGSGIGLASCKKIVDKMNGQISIDSQPGYGTTFIIDVPLDVVHKDEAPIKLLQHAM